MRSDFLQAGFQLDSCSPSLLVAIVPIKKIFQEKGIFTFLIAIPGNRKTAFTFNFSRDTMSISLKKIKEKGKNGDKLEIFIVRLRCVR